MPHTNNPFGTALPANAKVTEYTCPGMVGTFCETELGEPVLRSTDWFPLFGSHPPLAELFSISRPFEPASQGPSVESGNRVFALMSLKFVPVPSAGVSKPQSPTRLAVMDEQLG